MSLETRSNVRFGFALALGLGLIALGTVFAFENAGLEVPVAVTRLWPLLLVLVGLGRLAQRGFLRLGGHVLVFLGLFLTGLMLRPGLTLSMAGPAGLLWLGVIITLRALRPAAPRHVPAPDPSNASPTCD